MKNIADFFNDQPDETGYQERIPEYFHVFENTGPYEVSVKFDNPDISISKRRCKPQDLNGLIDESTGTFYDVMWFDDHPYRVARIQVSFASHTIKIITKPL